MRDVTLDDLIAVDTESNGGGSFGELKELWSIAWKSKGTDAECLVGRWNPNSFADRERLKQDWARIVGDKIPVFHNAAHDVWILRDMGLEIPVYHCSMIMGYNLNPSMRTLQQVGMKPSKYGLDAWGVRLEMPKLQHPNWEEWKDSPEFFDELPIYNRRDAEITWGIIDDLKVLKCLQADPLGWDYYCNVDLPFIEVIIEMNSTGLYVDLTVLEEWEGEMKLELDSLYQQLAAMASPVPSFTGTKRWHKVQHPDKDGYYTGEYREDKGWEFISHAEFSPTSAAHIKEVYKHVYGIELANTQEEYLEEKFGHIEFTQVLIEYKKIHKLLSTYCAPFRTKADEYGFVRAQFKQMCVTGRLSCEKPNLQNLPSRDARGATFRKFIVAPPGYKIVRVDLSNIELRVMTALQAHYFTIHQGYIPEDIQKIIDVFWNDPETPEGDFHGVMTTIWFGIDHTHPDFKHIRSNVSKHITFARTYGAGIAKLAAQMKTDYDTAKQRKRLADRENPSFNTFRQWIVEEFEQGQGWEHTFFGRRLFYPSFKLDPESDEPQEMKNGEIIPPQLIEWRIAKGERQAFNAKAGQGTAADILKMIALSILPYAWDVGGKLVCQVHDELLFYIPEDKVQEFIPLLYQCVNREDILPYVPVRGTPTYGDNWLECKG